MNLPVITGRNEKYKFAHDNDGVIVDTQFLRRTHVQHVDLVDSVE